MKKDDLNGRSLRADLGLPSDWSVRQNYHNQNKKKNSNFGYVISSPESVREGGQRWKIRGEYNDDGEVVALGWWGSGGNFSEISYDYLLQVLRQAIIEDYGEEAFEE
jgi:hypothetical protein